MALRKNERTVKYMETFQNLLSNPHAAIHNRRILEISMDREIDFDKIKPNPDMFELKTVCEKVNRDGNVTLILGKRGSGKTALGFKLVEEIHKISPKRTLYLASFPDQVSLLVPAYLHVAEDILDVPNGSLVLIDEAALKYASRKWQSKDTIEVTELIEVCRHKDLSMIFITQNSSSLAASVLRFVNTLLLKQTSLLQEFLERAKFSKIFKQAEIALDEVEDKNKLPYFFVFDDEIKGVGKSDLPSFWSESLSKTYSSFDVGKEFRKDEIDKDGVIQSSRPALCATCANYNETKDEVWCIFGTKTPVWDNCALYEEKKMPVFLFSPKQRAKV